MRHPSGNKIGMAWAAIAAFFVALALLWLVIAAAGQTRAAFSCGANSSSPCSQIVSTIYGTYIGAAAWDQPYSVAVDEVGNAYLTGYTQSITFPMGIEGGEPTHGIDVIAVKVNPTGSDLDYAIWFNAAALFAEDYGYAIAIDNTGSAYLTGVTNSADFCQYFGNLPGFDSSYNGSGDVFVLKINPAGNGLDYCTYLGSNDLDIARAIAVDDEGNAIVTGGTWSTDFVTTTGAFDPSHNGARDVFVTKLNATGTAVEYSTFLGGSGQDEATAIALDSDGNAFVTGWTASANFITTTNAYSGTHAGGTWDAFVTKINADGSDLVYSTFVGGSREDRGAAIAIDESGNAYVTGLTSSANFPATAGAFDESYGGGTCSASPCYDAYVFKLTPAGDGLVYATYLGDDGEDIGRGIAVDENGNAFVTGAAGSVNFPTTADALDDTLGGNRDAFVVKVNSSGSLLDYASFLGGSESDEGNALALAQSRLTITGHTFSDDFPVTNGAYNTTRNGDYDLFVTAFSLAGEPEPTPTPTVMPLSRSLYLPLVRR